MAAHAACYAMALNGTLEPFSLLFGARSYRITTNFGRNAGHCCYVKVRTALVQGGIDRFSARSIE